VTDQPPIFETERLIVRAATVADVEMYLRLWTDGRVMRNVGFPQGLPTIHEEIEARIRAQPQGAFDRMLVVELQSTGEAIGESMMHHPNEQGIAETDVKLLPEHWGHKYGVEVKRGLVAYLFTHTGCEIVAASPNVNNVPSIKMQEAVGGVRVEEVVYEFPEAMRAFTEPVHAVIYHVYRSDWEQRQEK
jgi:RimJ/RimL family protein N-acetyltransferase